MQNCLFPFFWQHGESHDVLENYLEKISESGMKGACIEARPHPEFVQDGWWSDMDIIIKKAKELDMKLWILDDSHFPTGFANGKIKKAYPQYLKWYLDMRRYDVQGPMKGARIDFKLLKGRPWDKPDMDEKVLGVYMAKRICQEAVPQDPIDAVTFVDLTSQLRDEDRLLTLDIPEGAYSIFVVYLTRKGGEDATKDYLNPLIKEATQVLIDEVYEPHYTHYRDEFGKTILGFFSDEPRFGNIKGTDGFIGKENMVLPWREGLESELGFDKKFLPLLWAKAQGEESEIRFCYMDNITRLYSENFTNVLGTWCKEHGVWYLGHTIEDNGAHARLGYGTGHYFRGQQAMDMAGIDVIGGQIVPGMNYHHDAFNTGGSNGEFYHYALAKLGTSAAHLDARKGGRTMCEAFGAYGWNEGLKTMKWIADHLLVRGVNYLVPHAFNPKEFPDFDCPPHFYAHGHNPQFRYFSTFSNYVNRVASIFREGAHPARVGLFYPAEFEWAGNYMPIEKPARELTVNQISFDIVTRDYLKAAKIENGFYTINGQNMEVLVFPYGECFPKDMSAMIEQMSIAGIQVIFLEKLPERYVGCSKKSLNAKWEAARVIGLKELGNELKEYKAVQLSSLQPGLVIGEYWKDGIKYYMMFNENIGSPVDTYVNLKERGYVYCYDAFLDKYFEMCACGDSDGYKLHLEPYESAVWLVSREKIFCEPKDSLKNWKCTRLEAYWKVYFADSFSYPNFHERVPLKSLSCAENLEGWDKKAGTLQYSGHIKIENPGQMVLDLGEVFETAQVFVNGVSAGIKICKPYQFELTKLVKQGENELIIEVTNTLGTVLREPISHYMVIEPFGIQGPVRMLSKEEME